MTALPFKLSKPEVVGLPLADITKKLRTAALESLVGDTSNPVPKVE